jgi:universal stress protein E
VSDSDRGNVNKVFVILDPTRMVQPALLKAEWVALRNSAQITLYCCISEADAESTAEADRLVEHARTWLERLAKPLRDEELEVEVRVDRADSWRDQIVHAASEADADLVVKTVSRHSTLRRKLTKTADWGLLATLKCPTLLVEPTQGTNTNVVLSAVKLNPKDMTHSALNQRVIAMSHRIATALDAELHAVTAYKGEGIYFDRQRFADTCQLPRSSVHAVEGTPERAIAEVVHEIGAGVVIVGCATNQVPERGVVIGDTAQLVIDSVDVDVVVIPAAS